MKRLLSSMTLVMLMIGCTSGEEGTVITVDPSTVEPLEELPEDIVDTHGEITNLEQLEEFIQKVEVFEPDSVRIISYTTEGDPIVKEVEFTGELFEITYDTRRDGFGSQVIRNYTCTAIDREETQSSVTFKFTGCEGEQDSIVLLDLPN
ncbi:DUF4362 domain-containing protein [Chryseomicrobium palamuruense]|uniref:DUF4362 domain-containing protein n=1 Tax=Chryseomicrobium palamuruense TaxID=682973 RepID=A0ABV8UWQ4_9BACL